MGTYHQLTEYQRYQIYALKKAGQNQQRIAETLRVSPSTICRELRRNRGQRGYRPGQAHQQALARRRTKAQATKMTPAVIERIEADLRQEWSPEQIAGRLAATDGLCLSPQRIYQHIQTDRQTGGTLYRHLRHSQKKRKKRYGKADARGQIKNRVSIDRRPAIVEARNVRRCTPMMNRTFRRAAASWRGQSASPRVRPGQAVQRSESRRAVGSRGGRARAARRNRYRLVYVRR